MPQTFDERTSGRGSGEKHVARTLYTSWQEAFAHQRPREAKDPLRSPFCPKGPVTG